MLVLHDDCTITELGQENKVGFFVAYCPCADQRDGWGPVCGAKRGWSQIHRRHGFYAVVSPVDVEFQGGV